MTGCSPIDYLIKMRIEKAVETMENNPKLNVTEVAMITGFLEQQLFYKKV